MATCPPGFLEEVFVVHLRDASGLRYERPSRTFADASSTARLPHRKEASGWFSRAPIW